MSMQTHILFSYCYNSKRSFKRQRVFIEHIRLFVDHCEKNYYLICFKIAEKLPLNVKLGYNLLSESMCKPAGMTRKTSVPTRTNQPPSPD